MMDAITPDMMQTFAALLLGHVLGDFLLQTGWMVARKREVPILLLHVSIVLLATFVALGGAFWLAALVGAAHLAIDICKTYAPARWRDGTAAFLLDQAAHLASLALLAALFPMAFSGGLWAPWAAMLVPMALTFSGFILCVVAGGYAVGILTSGFAPLDTGGPDSSLPRAGRLIGQLERTLIFLLIFIGQPAGIGFLIAAKSILRFETSARQQASEYVIIGTLASFTWALAAGYGTLTLLEIAAATP